jgi:hypothetical protein
MTSEPRAIITCGLDRRVRAWSINFEEFGVLLQSGDQSFKFPYDHKERRRMELERAQQLLKSIGPRLEQQQQQMEQQSTPALPPPGKQFDGLSTLSSLRGKRRTRKKDADWKATAERVIGDPEADEEDYRILFEQMDRVKQGDHESTANDVAAIAYDRLMRHSELREAERMRHRAMALSKDEARAADRLARAMEAVGADDFGTYNAMAWSLDPVRFSNKSTPLTARTPLSARLPRRGYS